MPPEIEEVFNPSEYTDRELLKLVYRDLHNFKEEFTEYKKNNNYSREIQRLDAKILRIEAELSTQKTLRQEESKRIQRYVAIIGLIIIVAQFVVGLVIK